MTNKIIAATVVVLSVAGLGWAWAEANREPEESAQVTEIKELAKEAFEEEKNDEESFEQRAEKFRQMGKLAESLSKDQMIKLADTFIPMMMKRHQQEVEAFFELSPAEQTAKLDEKIDEMEKWKAFGEKRRKEREEAAKRSEGVPKGGASGEGPRRERRGPWKNFTKEDRENMRRKFMDMTSPKTRAQFQEYRRMLNERRKERGLPEMRRRGGF